MPRISEFYGISVYVYYKDHAPPHVHVYYQDDEAIVQISDGQVLEGRIPRRARRLIEDWIDLHREAIHRCWDDAVNGVAPTPVPPLQ